MLKYLEKKKKNFGWTNLFSAAYHESKTCKCFVATYFSYKAGNENTAQKSIETSQWNFLFQLNQSKHTWPPVGWKSIVILL